MEPSNPSIDQYFLLAIIQPFKYNNKGEYPLAKKTVNHYTRLTEIVGAADALRITSAISKALEIASKEGTPSCVCQPAISPDEEVVVWIMTENEKQFRFPTGYLVPNRCKSVFELSESIVGLAIEQIKSYINKLQISQWS